MRCGGESGVRADLFEGVEWRKSSHSAPGGDCVEVAALSHDMIAARDSHDPQGPALICSTGEWEVFLSSVKSGVLVGLSQA
ncbi:DUF397 domain-containing protein [Streptomyces malaysiensis]|uniref:Regulator n=1 Tax=Streptomyces malaysiensis TaxID=92644 RepID=A0A7X6AY11_STRMQ|nr:DUF397 domain-containing protein [Streptomyces malaysiensis]NIY65632.1 regulator [Streptomyces malaysiensis]